MNLSHCTFLNIMRIIFSRSINLTVASTPIINNKSLNQGRLGPLFFDFILRPGLNSETSLIGFVVISTDNSLCHAHRGSLRSREFSYDILKCSTLPLFVKPSKNPLALSNRENGSRRSATEGSEGIVQRGIDQWKSPGGSEMGKCDWKHPQTERRVRRRPSMAPN